MAIQTGQLIKASDVTGLVRQITYYANSSPTAYSRGDNETLYNAVRNNPDAYCNGTIIPTGVTSLTIIGNVGTELQGKTIALTSSNTWKTLASGFGSTYSYDYYYKFYNNVLKMYLYYNHDNNNDRDRISFLDNIQCQISS